MSDRKGPSQRGYREVPRDDPLGGFEVGNLVCFCFHKPTDRTQRSWLNFLAMMHSFFIHCEVAVANKPRTESRTLYISKSSNMVSLAEIHYSDTISKPPWRFVWVNMTDAQARDMRLELEAYLTTKRKRFSNCRIVCYPCTGCYSDDTTTCSELAVTLLNRVWQINTGPVRYYSPDDVFNLLQTLHTNKQISINTAMTKANVAPDALADFK